MNTLASPWNPYIADYLRYLKAGGSPKTTIDTRRFHLIRCAKAFSVDPSTISATDLLDWFAEQEWAQETRRSHRGTHRSFWAWAVADGRAVEDLGARLPKVKPSDPDPQPVPERHYRKAIASAEPRTRLMLRMGWELGMRRGEIARSHSKWLIEDLDGWTIRIVGKGNKIRHVPMPDQIARELLALGNGYLFPGDDGGHLSARWVGTLMSRALPGAATAHKLRHSAGTNWHEASGGDTFVVQDLLGHASPATTRRYVKVKDSKLRAAVEAAA